MTKLVLADTNSGYNLSVINTNFDKIADYINNQVLSRLNATADPNQMQTGLDMNGNRILNLPTPIGLNEPARLQDIVNATIGILPIVPASLIGLTPVSGLTSNNVQSAIAELESNAQTETTTRATADAAQLALITANTTATNAATALVNTLNTNVAANNASIALLTANALVTPFGVGTVASLRSVSKIQHSVVQTSGYFAVGDGGGAVYDFASTDTTSADNGGSIIVAADGGRWYMRTYGVFNVRQWGAAAGPTTDVSAAIQKCFNASLGVGKNVIPAGVYYFTTGISTSGPLVIEADVNAIFRGAPTLNTTLLTVDNINVGGLEYTHRASIRGLTFDIQNDNVGLYLVNDAFLLSVQGGIVVENCQFTNGSYAGSGVGYLVVMTRVSNSRFTNCTFISNAANGLYGNNSGLNMTGCANSSFEGCQWNYNKVAITMQSDTNGQVTQGIMFNNCTGNGLLSTCISNLTEDCGFFNCLFDNHMGQAFSSVNDLGFTLINNYIGSSSTTGYHLNISCTSGVGKQLCRIRGNIFIAYAAAGNAFISLHGVAGTLYSFAMIHDNYFRNSYLYPYCLIADYVQISSFQNNIINGTPTSGAVIRLTNGPGSGTGLVQVNNVGPT